MAKRKKRPQRARPEASGNKASTPGETSGSSPKTQTPQSIKFNLQSSPTKKTSPHKPISPSSPKTPPSAKPRPSATSLHHPTPDPNTPNSPTTFIPNEEFTSSLEPPSSSSLLVHKSPRKKRKGKDPQQAMADTATAPRPPKRARRGDANENGFEPRRHRTRSRSPAPRRRRSRSRDRSRERGGKRKDRERDRDRDREKDTRGKGRRDDARARSRSPTRKDRENYRARSPPRGPRGGRSPPRGPKAQQQAARGGPAAAYKHAAATAGKTAGQSQASSLDPSRPHPRQGERQSDVVEGEDDEAAAMRAMMGFSSFKTTHNTKVPGNEYNYAIQKEKVVKYRQYMNRSGGFNRPLSPSNDS